MTVKLCMCWFWQLRMEEACYKPKWHKAGIIRVVQYNIWTQNVKKHKSVNIVKSHKSNQPNAKLTIKIAAKVTDENCALLGHYTASSGNFLSTFPDNLSVPSSGFKNKWKFLNPEEGTDTVSRNVFKKLPLLTS